MAAAGRARRARDRRRQPLQSRTTPEKVELHRIDPEAERRQLERTARVRAERNADEAARALAAVREAALGEANLLPPMREALRARCTIGEICETLRAEWGMYDAVRSRAVAGTRYSARHVPGERACSRRRIARARVARGRAHAARRAARRGRSTQAEAKPKPKPLTAMQKLNKVKHIVVIYEENHSFDNLYGGWEGVQRARERDRRAHDPGQPGGHAVHVPAAERRQPRRRRSRRAARTRRRARRSRATSRTRRSRSTTSSSRRDTTCPPNPNAAFSLAERLR